MPNCLLLLSIGTIFITGLVMSGGATEPNTQAYVALLLAALYGSAMWDEWFSNGRLKPVLTWANLNRARFIKMSTIDNFFFWVVLILAASVFISGWFLVVGALANTIFCHSNGVDVLGPPPEPKYIELN